MTRVFRVYVVQIRLDLKKKKKTNIRSVSCEAENLKLKT